MKRKPVLVLGGVLLTALGAAAIGAFFLRAQDASALGDPRQEPPVVRLVTAVQGAGFERGFTGIIAARVQTNLGFRVAGKIVERLVNVGQQVKAGQALMRIDETDLRLALTAKRNAVAAARASYVQTEADERRYAKLVSDGWTSRQRYEQAKAALDTAEAQLAAAEAAARVAENEATYSVLVADADGTVVDTLGEPGQVVPAGQTVVRLAHAGPREALVCFPKRSGRRSARRPTRACMAATDSAMRRICGSCRIPPIPRPGLTRPATCSTVRPRQRRSAQL